jgi:glycosyltransferase involved in cell wall biosynthesis
MNVLAVVPSIYDTSPGQRFRLEQWEPLLKDEGIEITYAPFETPELREVLYKSGGTAEKIKSVVGGLRRRYADLVDVKNYDVVYLFREAALLGPAWFERKIAASGVPMVFDFDDAVFESYKSPSNGYLSYLKFPSKTATSIRLSSHVMAGNPYLAEYSRRYNDNVTIIPTTIDTDKYTFEEPKEDPDPVTIGWSGSFSTVQHLDTVRDALQDLAKRQKFRLRVIGTPSYELSGVDVEALPWRSETEIEDLRPMDIGIMPLPDERWSKGKCGLKALQYMALGKPTVCAPVGVNTVIIQDGENGSIADSKEEWVAKLDELIQNSDLRKRLGRAGRETVENQYSARSQAPRVAEIFRSVAARGTKPLR